MFASEIKVRMCASVVLIGFCAITAPVAKERIRKFKLRL